MSAVIRICLIDFAYPLTLIAASDMVHLHIHPVTTTHYSLHSDFSIRHAAVVTAYANRNNITRRLQDDLHSNPLAP